MRWLGFLFTLTLMVSPLVAAPDNDLFVNSTKIVGTNAQLAIYRLDATREPGEPRHTGPTDERTGYGSVWFSWTAPADGWVLISEGFRSDLLCVVYEGEELQSLVPVARKVDDIIRLKVPVFQGRTYHIVASQPAVEEPFSSAAVATWSFQYFGRAVNDMFAARIRVGGSVVDLSGAHTLGATREPGEPPHADLPLTDTVWWEWTPPASGNVWIYGAPSFSGRLRAYSGNQSNALQPLPMPATFDRFEVQAGVPVQIAVGAYHEQLEGPVNLTLVLSPIRIVSPTNGAVLPDGTGVRIALTNVPPGVNRFTVIDQPYYAEFQGWTNELVLTNIAGGKYDFQIIASDDTRQFQYWLDPLAITVRPGADALADAREITPNDKTIGGDFAFATLEPGEPTADTPIQGSLWWRWTAPANGNVRLHPIDSNKIARDVFTTNATGQLTRVLTEDPTNPIGDVIFMAEQGTTYFIRLWQIPATAPFGWAASTFSFLETAANDLIADALELPVDGVLRILDRRYSTCEPNEPGGCDFDTGSRWYKLISSASGRLDLTMEASIIPDRDASIAVFVGTPDSLTPVSAPAFRHSISVEGARTYYIRLETPNNYPEGYPIWFSAYFAFLAPNDNVANAILLPATDGTVSGSTYLATREPEESPTVSGQDSVWYRFRAPYEGTFVARATRTEVSASQYAPQVSFARGNTAATLTWADDQARWGNVASIDLDAGEEIMLSVWSNYITGEPNLDFLLEHFFVGRPVNDNFANRLLVEGANAQFRGTNWNATPEPDEPAGNYPADRSVWWEWTAPASGALEVQTDLSEVDLFTGSETNLVPLTTGYEERLFAGRFFYPVTTGQRYFLRTASYSLRHPFEELALSGFDVSFRLNPVVLLSPPDNSTYREGEPILLEASLSVTNLNDAPRSVTFVQAKTEPGALSPFTLGTLTAPPYRLLVTNIFPSHHLFQAIVTNASGEVYRSQVANVRMAPGNDELTNGYVLRGRRMEGTAIISGSSQNTETGVHPSDGTIWYQWTPPVPGIVRWTGGFGAQPDLFFSTNSIGNVTNTSNLRAIGRLNNAAGTSVSPATNYWIRVAGSTNTVGWLSSAPFKLEQTTVAFTAPTNGAVLPSGSVAGIRVTTTERPEDVSGIRLFHGANLLATLFGSGTYEYLWTNPPAGKVELTAEPILTSGEFSGRATNFFTIRAANDLVQSPQVLPIVPGQIVGSWDSATATNNGPGSLKDLWYQWTAPADGVLFVRFLNTFHGRNFELYAPSAATNGSPWIHQTNIAGTHGGYGNWRVQSGVTYLLGAYGSLAATAPFILDFDFGPVSRNNDFADRFALSGEKGEVVAKMAVTTLELGEPEHVGLNVPAVGSAWWSWTAPFDGMLAITYPDGAAPFTVRPWLGDRLENLTPAPTAPGWGEWFGNGVFYLVKGGVPLQISAATPTELLSTIRWNWELLPHPPNDHFTNRINVRGSNLVLTGTTVGATREPLDIGDFVASVWWNWTAEEDGYLRMWLSGPVELAGRAYFAKTPQTFDSFQFIYSHVTNEVRVSAGDVLQLQVGSSSFPGGPFQLHLEMTATADNDLFSARERLTGTNIQFIADNRIATREFREPNHAAQFGGRSLWYAWTAPQNGTVEIAKDGYSEYMLLAAYQGTSVSNLTEVASAFIQNAPTVLRFDVRAGEEYALAVDNAGGYWRENPVRLTFTPRFDPPALQVTWDDTGALVFSAPDNRNWTLEESENLIQWRPLNPGAEGRWNIDPQTNTGQPLRFYRLKLAE